MLVGQLLIVLGYVANIGNFSATTTTTANTCVGLASEFSPFTNSKALSGSFIPATDETIKGISVHAFIELDQ